jgi:FkbM family methyltransferase
MKTFIEIGSSHFDTLNHLSDFGWRGVIVEPIKKYIDQLEQKENVYYLNFAIDTYQGHREIWLAADELIHNDNDYSGMSSFYKDYQIQPHINYENSEVYIHDKSIIINTITYQDIINICNVVQVDYLRIDTEGHGWEILKQVHMNGSLRPKIIKVEHKHSKTKDLMKEYLSSNGYHCEIFPMDIIAIDITI